MRGGGNRQGQRSKNGKKERREEKLTLKLFHTGISKGGGGRRKGREEGGGGRREREEGEEGGGRRRKGREEGGEINTETLSHRC